MEKLLQRKDVTAAIRKLKADARFHNEQLLKVVYQGKAVPWQYNLPQRLMHEARQRQERAGKPVRLVVLKARREGISTLSEGWLYHKVTTLPYRTAMVVSHELDSANEIFEMTRRFWEFQPEQFRPQLPSSTAPRGREMLFQKLGSKVKVDTANDVTAGRSMTIDALHCSEVAYWRDAATLMLGLLQCVNDDDPDTIVIIESTANGEGGWFYNLVIGAQNGENDFLLVFLPWFIDPRYRMEVPPDTVFTDDEEAVRKKYIFQDQRVVLTDEQLYWRRHIIRNKCEGNVQKFQQEYPGSIEEAFIVSGRKRFVREHIDAMASRAKPPVFRGFLKAKLGHHGWKFDLEKNENGQLRIYEQPLKGERYAIFADVAEGKIITEAGQDPDFSTIGIMKCRTMEEVAVWHGRCPPELLADEFNALGRYYNEAFGSPEKNSKGYACLVRLQDLGYVNLYAQEKQDKIGNQMVREYGWETNQKTKPVMIDELALALRDGEIQSHHERTHEELRRFAILDDGSLGAPHGLHDDCVIRLAGLVQMRKAFYTEDRPEASNKADWNQVDPSVYDDADDERDVAGNECVRD